MRPAGSSGNVYAQSWSVLLQLLSLQPGDARGVKRVIADVYYAGADRLVKPQSLVMARSGGKTQRIMSAQNRVIPDQKT